MPEYPDNSHSARENTSPPSKRVEKVVNGTAKTRKQSEVKKFAGIFMPDEVGDVKTFIITDVVTPTVLRLSSLWAQTNRFVLRTLNPV